MTLSLLHNLQKELADETGPLADWSRNYFKTHQNRYLFDLKLLETYYTKGKVLEIGSAPLHLTFLMKQAGYDVTGIDIQPERQRTFIKRHQLQIIKCNIEIEELPFEDDSFNFIILNEVFEHLRINPISTLREINRVLHPSGTLILSTPNFYNIRNIVNMFRGKGFDDPYAQFHKLETIGHMGHVREYTISQVKNFLEKTGFKSMKVFRKSFVSLSGIWTVFKPFLILFPNLRTYQIHICNKQVV